MALSPDGGLLATCNDGGEVQVWDTAAGKLRHKVTVADAAHAPFAVAFSPDGRTLATSGVGLRLWDTATWEAGPDLASDTESMTAVAFSPDGRLVAAGTGFPLMERKPGEVRLWDAATGKRLPSLKGHLGPINAVAFSPGGRRLASASDDKTVKLWDLGTGLCVATYPVSALAVTDVAFSPDGSVLAAASFDGSVRLWHGPAEGGR
jgi:WD40 repeat protein